jgi:hypothetical protein
LLGSGTISAKIGNIAFHLTQLDRLSASCNFIASA